MTFDEAVEIILEFEGGYVNDPKDPGGETKFGISKRSHPNVDIKNLTRGYAKFIYHNDYWNAVKAEGLPDVWRLIVFDCAVNQGVDAAIKMLQAATGAKVDGIIGPMTLHSARAYTVALPEYIDLRVKRYFATKGFRRFGQGWIRRLSHIIYLTMRNS